MQRLRAGILGATGAVGQQFVRLLAEHPWFDIAAVAASERSAGKTYREATNWIGADPMPESVADLTVEACEPGLECDFVFSGLDASVAGDVEKAFAAAGYPVISNARNHRMDPSVPLLIPEVNPQHTALIDRQEWEGGGYIVTNPNCSTVGLVCALKPLADAFGLEKVQVSTMQALSGAGYPGVSSLDILGNVIPFIPGEEEKLETEPRKLLGAVVDDGIQLYDVQISAQCNRVPVLDGHLETVSLSLTGGPDPDSVVDALRGYRNPLRGLELPTAPEPFLEVFDEQRFPQPRRHANLGGGMTVSVGRVRPCRVLNTRLVVLSHNTVRGAAGGAILNAELLVHQGRLSERRQVTAKAS